MDARDFALFLKQKLLDRANQYNEILYSVSYKNMEQGKWISGVRMNLISLADSMGDLLKEFHERKD